MGNIFKDEKLKKRVKDMIKYAKENNLIKPHTEAFKKYPVEKTTIVDHKDSQLGFMLQSFEKDDCSEYKNLM